jgi:hypothetical protein
MIQWGRQLDRLGVEPLASYFFIDSYGFGDSFLTAIVTATERSQIKQDVPGIKSGDILWLK